MYGKKIYSSRIKVYDYATNNRLPILPIRYRFFMTIVYSSSQIEENSWCEAHFNYEHFKSIGLIIVREKYCVIKIAAGVQLQLGPILDGKMTENPNFQICDREFEWTEYAATHQPRGTISIFKIFPRLMSGAFFANFLGQMVL